MRCQTFSLRWSHLLLGLVFPLAALGEVASGEAAPAITDGGAPEEVAARRLADGAAFLPFASPSTVPVQFLIEVPAHGRSPRVDALPVIRAGTTVEGGAYAFTLLEDLDFSSKKKGGALLADSVVASKARDGSTRTLALRLAGLCSSSHEDISQGRVETESKRVAFSVPKGVSADTALSEATTKLMVEDPGIVGMSSTSAAGRVTITTRARPHVVVQPGAGPSRLVDIVRVERRGGSALRRVATLREDPVNGFAISRGLDGTTTIRLGSAVGDDDFVTIVSRRGGGLDANVDARAIRTVGTARIEFPLAPPDEVAEAVRQSLEVVNTEAASGGENELPASEAIELAATSDDPTLAILGMPNRLGRPFRVAEESSGGRTTLFVVNRDRDGRLVQTGAGVKASLAQHAASVFPATKVDVRDACIVTVRVAVTAQVADMDPAPVIDGIRQAFLHHLPEMQTIGGVLDLSAITDEFPSSVRGVTSARATLEAVTGKVGSHTYGSACSSAKKLTVDAEGRYVIPDDVIIDLRYPDSDVNVSVSSK
jgi:hypothetical protein